jgi:hypothetical protein
MKTFEANRLTVVGGGAQLLTATVKLFLKKPTEGPQAKIQAVLQMATQETDNPDLRDRAYVYWRLLSTDPEAAKVKPTPSTATGQPWGLDVYWRLLSTDPEAAKVKPTPSTATGQPWGLDVYWRLLSTDPEAAKVKPTPSTATGQPWGLDVYWRLLSTDPEAAKVKPTPSTATGQPWGLAYRVPPPSQRLLVAGATLATNLPRLQQLFRPAECRFVERVE